MHQFGLLRAGKVLRAALACAALIGLSACATNPSSSEASPVAAKPAAQATEPVAPQADVPVSNTTVAELQGLIRDHKVDELRTIYNASYGASMLFKPDDLTYYVVLFQQRNFWQVVKTQSFQQADMAYRAFVARTAELAQADFERIRLEAENAKAQELLNARLARLSTLQADQALRQQQDQLVAARQNQINAETDRLNQQQEIARSQLNNLQRQIDALQAEQNRLLGIVNHPVPSRRYVRPAHRTYRKPYSHSYHSRTPVHRVPAAHAAKVPAAPQVPAPRAADAPPPAAAPQAGAAAAPAPRQASPAASQAQ
nr:DUF2968 domain-containing protein [Bordetella sp. FB-8]